LRAPIRMVNQTAEVLTPSTPDGHLQRQVRGTACAEQQQREEDAAERTERDVRVVPDRDSIGRRAVDSEAGALVGAFYVGLGSNASAVTLAIRRRDQASQASSSRLARRRKRPKRGPASRVPRPLRMAPPSTCAASNASGRAGSLVDAHRLPLRPAGSSDAPASRRRGRLPPRCPLQTSRHHYGPTPTTRPITTSRLHATVWWARDSRVPRRFARRR
jgi:hypothetical protein